MNKFKNPVSAGQASRLILRHYFQALEQAVDSDVIIVGAGPSGLVCAFELGEKGYDVTLIDRHLVPGGGIWGGATSFNKVILQKDVDNILTEFGIPYQEDDQALVVSALTLASKLIFAASSHPKVKLFNLMTAEDIHCTEGKVDGVVIISSAIEVSGLHVDPMVLMSKAVLDATGHDAVIANLYSRRIPLQITKESFMNPLQGEEDVIRNTRMIAPGLFVAGMAATNISGGCRMGPIFGGMLLSGKKAAQLIAEYI
ncbi:MAG: thiazole biosynthesis protein [Firmicutes bacterium]|nr:thiazole biosynthesis protein [Bacillota bacterium]